MSPMPRRSEPWTPEARWRDGDRDDEARAAHAVDTRERRRAAVVDELDRAAPALLVELREHGDLARAAEAAGTTRAAVQGRMRWDTAWAERIDDILAETCAAGEHCGTPTGYRHHGGRCPACRATKTPTPSARVCQAPGCTRALPVGARSSRRTCSTRCRVALSRAASRAARTSTVRQRVELTDAQRAELGDPADLASWTARARVLIARDGASIAALARAAELSAAGVHDRLRRMPGHDEAPPP